MASEPNNQLNARLKHVQILLCDVDGVLTDASVYLGDRTGELKAFNIQDGLGIVNLRDQGIQVGWISSRVSGATSLRASELKIDFLHQSKGSKTAAIDAILQRAGLAWDQVCYVGDDVVDIGPMSRAGVAVAVANATPDTKACAHYVTTASGGHGAVREICELILKAQGKWAAVLEKYRE